MALTYTAIATVTVGSGGAANMTFSSIPGTYTDLLIKISARTDRATNQDSINIRPNNSTTNLSIRYLMADGATPSSTSDTSFYVPFGTTANTSTASTFGNVEVYIPNYAGSNNKSISADGVNENNATTAYQTLSAGLWSNSAAITSLVLTPLHGTNFVQYTTATLYGIKATV